MGGEIEVTRSGVVVKIDRMMSARDLFKLERLISDALFEYKDEVGWKKFREEMAFDPGKNSPPPVFSPDDRAPESTG